MKFLLILTMAGALGIQNERTKILSFDTKDALTAYLNTAEVLTGPYATSNIVAYSTTPLTISWLTKMATTQSTVLDKAIVK